MYEIIKQLCQQNGTTITALCEQITGSKGNLATWKKGNIRTDYLKKISEYFNVSTDYLLGNEPKEKPLDEEIKFALFNGADGITDEMYEEVKRFAELVKIREQQKGEK